MIFVVLAPIESASTGTGGKEELSLYDYFYHESFIIKN